MQDKQPNFGPLMGIGSVSRTACINQSGVGPYIKSSKCVRPFDAIELRRDDTRVIQKHIFVSVIVTQMGMECG
jgi:hypothetical protein